MSKTMLGINKMVANTLSNSVSNVSKSINYSMKSMFLQTRKNSQSVNDEHKKYVVNIYNSTDDSLKRDWSKISKDYQNVGDDIRKAIANYEQ